MGLETTRHFTTSVYVVNDGATALHEHWRLGITIPPGGHVDRGELPHEAAVREVREETGLAATLLVDHPEFGSDTSRTIPRPRHLMLSDVNVYDGEAGHQHVDHIYYATVPSRDVDPAPGEADVDAWDWYAPDDLRASDLDADVVRLGLEAIEAATER